MATPFDTTDEDMFINQSKTTADNTPTMTGTDVSRVQEFFSRLGEDRPFIGENVNRNPKQQSEEEQKIAESEVLGANVQAEEFAKARQEFSNYNQQVDNELEPVKQSVNLLSVAQKKYNEQLAKLNDYKIGLLASGAAGTQAGRIRMQQAKANEEALNAMWATTQANLGAKTYQDATPDLRETYASKFLPAVQQGMVTPDDAWKYTMDNKKIESTFRPAINKLISNGEQAKAKQMEEEVFGKQILDPSGNPIGIEGGIVKTTPFGTYTYGDSQENFVINADNIFKRYGVSGNLREVVQKPLDLWKQEEDLLKSRISITEDRLKLVPEEDEETKAQLTNLVKNDQETLSKINDLKSKAAGIPGSEETIEISKQQELQKEISDLNQFVPEEDNGREIYNTKATSIVEKYNIPSIEAEDNIDLLKKRRALGLKPGDFYAFKQKDQPLTFKQIPEIKIQDAEELSATADKLVNDGIATKIKDGYLVQKANISDKDKKKIDIYNETLRNIQFGS